MNRLKNKLKESFFMINKLYVFLIFLWLSFVDITVAIAYFGLSLVIFTIKTLKAKVPILTNKKFAMKTYVYKLANSNSKKVELKVDIWYPDTDKKNIPLVYFCHGGGWISGFRNQPNNISWCNLLADRGFAVASIDYRFGYKNTMLDLLSDYADGLEFIKKNSAKLNIDKNNIVLMGLSAGAHLSLLYSTYFSSTENKEYMEGIKAVVAYYPPADLKDILKDDNKSLFAKFGVRQTLKDSPSDIDDIYKYYSPITYVSKHMIPTLLAHGEEDTVVPFISSVKFSNALFDNKINHEFLIHKTADHSFDTILKDYTTINIIEKTIRFIKKHTR